MVNYEAPKRHAILHDRAFWLRIEFELSGWLSESSEPQHRRFWIDGFIPSTITDTRNGADITGEVWMATHGGKQRKFSFLVSIPQTLLYRPSAPHNIAELGIDEPRLLLQVVLAR